MSKKAAPLAPNDEKRVPQGHRDLINQIHKILAEADLDVFESQHIASAATLLCTVRDLSKGQEVMNQIVEAIKVTENAQRDVKIIVEILNLKMTEAMNKTRISDLEFKEM